MTLLRSCSAVVVGLLLLWSPPAAPAKEPSKRILVDDFERPGSQNRLGGNSGAFSDSKGLGSCYVFPVTNPDQTFGRKGTSLPVQWDTAKAGSFAGYWSNLQHLNLEQFNYLTFQLRGLAGGEKFKIGLRGKADDTYETKVLIDDAVKEGTTKEWKKVVMPLKWFKSVQDWKDVSVVSINFEQAFGSDRGAILIDDIAFEK